MNFIKRTLFSFALSLLAVCTAWAQNGTLAGKVVEAETGFEVIGASIIVSGTTTGVSSDLDGSYLLELEPGTYSIECSYMGYEPQKFDNIVIKKGEVTTLDIKMGEAMIDLGIELVVEAEAINSTESAMVTTQKKSAVVLDGISAAQISRTGDRSAAAAIQRIPGVTVQDGKYVYVRGLGDRYSKTTLNGAEIPGLDPNRNTVQMDLFPSNLLDNLIVYKTFSPDLYGDFTGGYVDIETKNFPDKFMLNASASMGYNTVSTFQKNTLGYKGGKLDWLGFDDGTRSKPEEVAQYGFDNFPQYQGGGVTDPAQAEALANATQSFSNNWAFQRKARPFNHAFSFSIGDQVNLFKRPLGIIAALTYNRQFSSYEGGRYGIYELNGMYDQVGSLTNQLTLTDDKGSDDVLWGALLGLSYKINNNNKISINVIRNQASTSSSRYLVGRKQRDDPDDIFETRTWRFLQRSLSTFQLIGKHVIPQAKGLEIKWQSSYAISEQNDPDLRYFTNRYNELAGHFIKPSSDRVPSRFYRDMKQANWSNRLDFTMPFKSWKRLTAKAKVGGSYGFQNRSFREDRYTFAGNGVNYAGNPTVYFADSNLLAFTPGEGNYANDGIYVVNDLDPANSYDARQHVVGMYGMVDLPITKKLRIITGLRVERTMVQLYTFSDVVLAKYPSLNGKDFILNNWDFLPALNVNYDINDQFKVRAAYSRTLARPTFRELAPFASFDVEGGYLIVGNPELQRTLVDNADLRFEWYPSPADIISVSGFYKNFHAPIERTFNPQQPNGEFTYRNVESAFLAGAELEIRKNLGFITPALKHMSLVINASYIYSQTTVDSMELVLNRSSNPDAPAKRIMFGQSPYSINAQLTYDNPDWGFETNLVFNVVGPRLSYITIGATPDIYEMPRGMLNFNVSKELVKNFSMRLSINNLLNTKYREVIKFKDREYDVQSYPLGITFNLGIQYNIR